MTREEAQRDLASPDTDNRLKAARFFAMNAIEGDRQALRAALRDETVPWIKKALQRSLKRAELARGSEEPAPTQFADPPPRLVAELRAKAIEDVAGTIIHELATLVASLQLAAPRDIPNYKGSRTEALITSLLSLLSGIRSLKASASKAEYVECDLAEECRSACAILIENNERFRFAGPAPFMAELDPNLLKLALVNVIKNAVEATDDLPEGREPRVTLNWGRTRHEIWIAVLDNGFGFERDPSSLIEFGQSTKDEHIGFGLATAKQAMQAMEGDIHPANAADGGARVEIRWFTSDENPLR